MASMSSAQIVSASVLHTKNISSIGNNFTDHPGYSGHPGQSLPAIANAQVSY